MIINGLFFEIFENKDIRSERELKQLNIFGNDYNTPDGSCIRDYIDVVDLAKAHIIAIERLLDKRNDNNLEIYNLGTGNGLSVLEIIKIFENVSNTKLNYKII